MKPKIFLIALLSFFCLSAYAQNTPFYHKGIPDTHLKPFNFQVHRTFGPDTIYRILNYDSADAEAYNHVYLHNQGQLMNMYYNFPTDTTGSYKNSSMFYQNYFCVNYVSVAFDSLFDPYADTDNTYSQVNQLGIDTIYIPFVHVNYTGLYDTIELQLNTVDAYGYPTTATILDTIIVDKDTLTTDDATIQLLKWYLGGYLVTGKKFAITFKYFGSKSDSCWFIYGYGNFTGNCQNGTYTLAKPTHFSKVGTKPYLGNSFALWNQYAGGGLLPTENDNDIFFPCGTDVIFKPDTDGANYFQNINIFALLTVYLNPTGIEEYKSPVTNIENFPNPFSNSTDLKFTLSQSGDVSLKITDLTGREIIYKDLGPLPTGEHATAIDGNELESGIYFYTLTVNGQSLTNKMCVVK